MSSFTHLARGFVMLAGMASAASTAGIRDGVPVPAGITRHEIDVRTVDPTAEQAANRHTGQPNKNLVVLPQASERRTGRLFLYIVGSGISETTAQRIMQAGAQRGYHGIAIAYRNYEAVVPLCARSPDPDCTEKVREEILTGADLTPLVTIGPKDALEPRLAKLLAYLAATYPDEGWNAYLRNGAIDWGKIVAAGHSQGAGHVALLAKRHAMLRAVMISGVADMQPDGRPAPWLGRPNLTPVDRQFGFGNVADRTVTLPVAVASWKAIGLKGPLTSVDGAAPPYGGSHMLSTAVSPRPGTNVHVGMVDDATLALAGDGTPVHQPVWDFTIFPRD